MKKKKREFDTTTPARAVGFLVWFRNQYQVWTNDTFCEMAEKYGQGNYGTCRNMILVLAKAGYIKIWTDGGRKRRYYLDLKKYNELVYPHVFQPYDPRTKTTYES
jgi:hypothetical protein